MAVTSGDRPYQYVGPYPFSSSGEALPVGYSGILFEQGMFTLIAESEIYFGGKFFWYAEDDVMNKYINKQAGLRQGITPDAFGRNLDGTFNGIRGDANYRDYIMDMRFWLSGVIFDAIADDSVYQISDIALDYFRTYFGDNPSGSVGNWRHADPHLGYKGNLYDIDLREVLYQPYIRFGDDANPSISGTQIFIQPMMPRFSNRASGLVYVNDRDFRQLEQLGEYFSSGCLAARGGSIFVVGDMFDSGNSKIFYTWDTHSRQTAKLISTMSGTCRAHGPRELTDFSGMNRGYAIFSPPSGNNVGTGIYSVQVYNESEFTNGIFVPQSGATRTLGWWPRQFENIGSAVEALNSGHLGAVPITRGFHYMDGAFYRWNQSGALIVSSIGGTPLWLRWAEQIGSSGTWHMAGRGGSAARLTNNDCALVATPITGLNDKITICVGTDPGSGTDFIRFLEHDKQTFDNIRDSHVYISGGSEPYLFQFITEHIPSTGHDLNDLYLLNGGITLDMDFNPMVNYIQSNYTYGMLDGKIMAGGSGTNSLFAIIEQIYDIDSSGFLYASGFGPNIDVHYASHLEPFFSGVNHNSFALRLFPQDRITWIDPRGTPLDKGDGSVYLFFTDRFITQITPSVLWLGRLKQVSTSGAEIIEVFRWEEGHMSEWCGAFT